MDYELCKQLKDVGFPQQTGSSRCPCHEPWGMCGLKEHLESPYYIPTLSELIAECGNRFQGLSRRDDGTFGCLYKETAGYVDFTDVVEGKTPEEAVAKLYIALHS